MPSKIPTFRPAGSPSPGENRRSYERQRSRREDIAFYKSPPWLRIRRLKLAENPCCEPCEAEERTTPAVHVHHRVERKQRPDLALDYENLESVCLACHNAKRRKG